MPEGHDTIIEVSNIMSFVLYTQILKQSVLKPASPGITLKIFLFLLYDGVAWMNSEALLDHHHSYNLSKYKGN